MPGRKNFDTIEALGAGLKLRGGVVQLLLEYPGLAGLMPPEVLARIWDPCIQAKTLRSEVVPHPKAVFCGYRWWWTNEGIE